MKNNVVGWFEIYVQDMARAKAFYEAVFAVELQRLPGTEFEMFAFPMQTDGYGAPGALIHIPGCPSGGGGNLVYFSCFDCAEQVARVHANGGKIHRDKFAIAQYGFAALVIDSEGNLIGLHSMQ